ncbi:hypothetical protein CKM354_000329600 [Cercospora kikuchii]|uniref:Uncharacterized protein n=1 Tax=Cercospora kikuchii TaxID=84275 RepID=A0A9P3CBK1_9PEZI|nr:uncharacterized protein CKM354_000329600 [Cercospora kikuchii]GIZ39934.1 hypothetical protein CKM354_000329600 [Cercospora kikuchii]
METIHESRYTCEIPRVDLLTFVFSSGDVATRQRPQYFDADHPERHYSLSQGESHAKRVAKGLRDLGLQDDDKVLLYSGNNLFFPVLLWGVIGAGCVFTATSPSASLEELTNQLRDSDSKLLLTSLDGIETALKAATAVGIPQERVYVFCDPQDASTIKVATRSEPWTSLWASEHGNGFEWPTSTDPDYLARKTIILNYSSGTTGPPKGVEITHANVVANSAQLIHYRTMVGKQPSAYARQERLARSGERWLAPLPMYHAYGQIYYCVNAPRMSAKVYIMSKYDVRRLLLFVDIYRITFLTAVPTVLIAMAKHPRGVYNLQSLEYALTGSAPLGHDIASVIEKHFLRPGLELKNGWGLTETTNSISGFCPDDENDGRSVGYLNPNCAGRVVPVEGQSWDSEVPPGILVGEIWVSGQNIMKGYYKNPKATAETVVVQNGRRWLRTGDIGYFEDGRIYIIDRLKELIKVKGLQVSPSELEAAILLHEGVADVAVTGAKLEMGECPRAFVVRKDPELQGEQIHDLIRSKFSKHKWLTGGVYFIDEIPKTPSGKTKRRLLPIPPNTSKL